MDDPTTIPHDLDVIRAKLARLRERDPRHAIFGSKSHGYALGNCLGEEQLRSLEKSIGIRLPESYRQFLLQLGNGGAGPDYGFLALEESLRDCPPGRLTRPFPAVFAAPVSSTTPQDLEGSDEVADEPEDLDPLSQDSRRPDALCQWVRYSDEGGPAFPSPAHSAGGVGAQRRWDEEGRRPGAIEVAHYGCGITAPLVVTGSERGAMWVDDPNSSFTCDLYPVGRGGWMGQGGWERMAAHPDKRLDFLAWYDDWLDDALVTLDMDRLEDA
jgi:hypothetical protein